MLVRAFAALALVLFVGAAPSAIAAPSGRVLAQASPAASPTDVTGDLPSGTWILGLTAIGLAAYISYRLGQRQETEARRREGPISRALGSSKKQGEN